MGLAQGSLAQGGYLQQGQRGLAGSGGLMTQSSSFQQSAQPIIGQGTYTQQPIGMSYTTQAVPLFPAPMAGTPYGSHVMGVGSAPAAAGAKTGKRHHHGVLHRNAH